MCVTVVTFFQLIMSFSSLTSARFASPQGPAIHCYLPANSTRLATVATSSLPKALRLRSGRTTAQPPAAPAQATTAAPPSSATPAFLNDFQCPRCPKHYTQLCNLRRHWEAIHQELALPTFLQRKRQQRGRPSRWCSCSIM